MGLRERVAELEEIQTTLLDFIEDQKVQAEAKLASREAELAARHRAAGASEHAEALTHAELMLEESRDKQRELLDILGSYEKEIEQKEREIGVLREENRELNCSNLQGDSAAAAREAFRQEIKLTVSAHIRGSPGPEGLGAPISDHDVVNYVGTALKMKSELYSRKRKSEIDERELRRDLESCKEELRGAKAECLTLREGQQNVFRGHHEAEKVLWDALEAQREAEEIAQRYMAEFQNIKAEGITGQDAEVLLQTLQELEKELHNARALNSQYSKEYDLWKSSAQEREAELSALKSQMETAEGFRTPEKEGGAAAGGALLAETGEAKENASSFHANTVAALKHRVERAAFQAASSSTTPQRLLPARASYKKTELRKTYPEVFTALSAYADDRISTPTHRTPRILEDSAVRAGTLQERLNSLQSKFSKMKRRYR